MTNLFIYYYHYVGNLLAIAAYGAQIFITTSTTRSDTTVRFCIVEGYWSRQV